MSRSDDFDALMAALDSPMAVVTTVLDGERAGCLIGFHSQCSIEPQRTVIWLSKANHTYRVAIQSERIAVHFLRAEDRDLAVSFGTTSGDDVDKFATVAWTEGEGGLPLLDRCPNRIVARRVTLVDDGGDHVCLTLEPVEVHRGGPFRPLRLSDVDDLDPGHGAEERPRPETHTAP